jgi:hypothetical protein
MVGGVIQAACEVPKLVNEACGPILWMSLWTKLVNDKKLVNDDKREAYLDECPGMYRKHGRPCHKRFNR